MGISTTAYLKGKVYFEDIADYIRQNYSSSSGTYATIGEMFSTRELDSDVQDRIIRRLGENGVFCMPLESVNGELTFKDEYGNDCRIFYAYDSWLDDCIAEESPSLEPLASIEHTFLCMDHNENSANIMKGILDTFGGGWLSENDIGGPEYSYYGKKAA